ncbi:MAG TPA: hypothetical protein VEH84_11025, partial [Alphaproteobacteria bacterium]|nr:hypothetical protein [Alphaproteobacteria bacterium]
ASDFSALRRALIWENCPALPGRDPALWRLDSAGRAIHLPAYGRSDAEYGWLLHGTEALHWATLAEHGGH